MNVIGVYMVAMWLWLIVLDMVFVLWCVVMGTVPVWGILLVMLYSC